MSLRNIQHIGLTQTESHLYELLVKLGEVSVSLVIAESKLKRPTVYKALQSLEKKGLVILRDIRKKLHVKPESPTKLQDLVNEQAKKVDEAKSNLAAFLPALIMNYTHSTDRPVVKLYEGLTGIKELYEDTIRTAKPIVAVLQSSEVDPELYHWLTTSYVKKRTKAKIHAKVLVASGPISRKYTEKSKEEYRTTKQVDGKQFPFQHEINVYGDKVAIINFKKDEPLMGILIHHPRIATTMRAWFDLAWGSIPTAS